MSKPQWSRISCKWIYIYRCSVHQHGSKITFKCISRCWLVIIYIYLPCYNKFVYCSKDPWERQRVHHLRLLDLRRGWENPQMMVICKGIFPQIAHLVPFIPCWMKRQKWNVDSIYPNFKGKIPSRYHEFFLLFGDEILHFFRMSNIQNLCNSDIPL